MATSTAPNASNAAVHISTLPMEILSQLPHFLDNLDDLYALLSTSRLFYHACAGTSAKLPPSPTTDKRLTLAGTARQVADWAVQSQEHRDKLWSAIEDGNYGLLRLASEVARMSLDGIRALHGAKLEIINPMVENLRKQCQKCGQGKFHKKHCLDFTTALYDFVTYCELFHHDVVSWLYKDSAINPLGLLMRLHWISRCLPDGTYKNHRSPVPKRRRLRDLTNLCECGGLDMRTIDLFSDMVRNCDPTRIPLTRPKFNLFSNFLQHQGWSTLRMVLCGGFSDIEERTRCINAMESISALDADDDNLKESDHLEIYHDVLDPGAKWDSVWWDMCVLARDIV